MPRVRGAKNYKNELLIPIVAEILPNGEYGWQAVAMAYQEQSREENQRDTDDLKRHWTKNLCNGFKKPTGKPDKKSGQILRCIAIERKIMDKMHAGVLGIDESEEDEVVVVGGEGEQGGGQALRHSPSRVAKTQANNNIRSQLASTRAPTAEIVDSGDEDARVVAEWERRREEEDDSEYDARIDQPPTPIVGAYTRITAREVDGEFVPSPSPKSPSMSQSFRSALDRAAESTPPLSKSVSSAIAKASSLAKSEKTKNSSNKSKERTSIAGTIVKMLERMDSSSGGGLGGSGDMAAAMNMMMLRQMDAMNRSMAQREKDERREKAREKKRRRKRRARREAKRRVLEDLDDHGGKGAGSFSDSSAYDSSSSSGDDSSQDSAYGMGKWRRPKMGGGGRRWRNMTQQKGGK